MASPVVVKGDAILKLLLVSRRLLNKTHQKSPPLSISAVLSEKSALALIRRIRTASFVMARITEKLVVHKRIGKTSWSNTPQELRELSPTGRLAILIGHEGFGETLIVDKPGALLETQWEKIIDAVELQHKTAIETVRAWALQRQRAEESDRVRREEARRREAELLRRQALLQEVRDWEAAQSLRSYLGHLFALRDSGGVVPADFDEWSSWVTSVADSMDSSLRRVRPVEPD